MLSVLSAFLIMLSLGSVYGWSLIASFLIADYGFTAAQTQLIFGTVLSILPITMIIMGSAQNRLSFKQFCYLSGLLFTAGYLLAGNSNGNFILILLGVGILGGIATGIGYWIALNSSVRLFPEKKGLITGIVAAGFGLGAVVMSQMAQLFLSNGSSILSVVTLLGIIYGITIFIFGSFIHQVEANADAEFRLVKPSEFLKDSKFHQLFAGMFVGTFAGLLVIGGLAIIGASLGIPNETIVLSISLFAFANFLGRLVWGYFSDIINIRLIIFISLLYQCISILLLNVSDISAPFFVFIVVLIGFGFGSNFVLYAKIAAQVFGLANFGTVYPYVFASKSIAALTGPIIGGAFYDSTGSFYIAVVIGGAVTFIGAVLFLYSYLKERKLI